MKKPKILLIGGEKGGTGKSTLCTNLASLLATDGQDVLIIDTDRQGSSSDWCIFRSKTDLPKIEYERIYGNTIISKVPGLAKQYDNILIDAGGRDSAELRNSMKVSDLMLTPVRASQYDVSSLYNLKQIVSKAGASIQIFAVINSLKGNPKIPEFQEALTAIEGYGHVKPLPFAIRDRIAFTRTGQTGQGVHEMENPDKKAITEIQTLYNHIYGNR